MHYRLYSLTLKRDKIHRDFDGLKLHRIEIFIEYKIVEELHRSDIFIEIFDNKQ